MKIIKQGDNKPKEAIKKCLRCGTKFSYSNADIKPDWRDGSYVNCPSCGNYISAEQIFHKF